MVAIKLGDHEDACVFPSSNLVRRVVDRVGLRCEAAYSEEALQVACREKPAEPPSMLTVATDGSMLLTREASWGG